MLKLPRLHLLSQNTHHPFEAIETAHLRRGVHRCHAVLGPHVQRSASLGNKEFEHLEVALLRRQVHGCNVVVHLRVGAATYIMWHHASSWRRQFKLPPSTMSPRSRPSAVGTNHTCTSHVTGREVNCLWQVKGERSGARPNSIVELRIASQGS